MIKIFKDEKKLSITLAKEILSKLKNKKKLILGCPGGRSLKKTYYYLGILSFKYKISLDKLSLIMMDEYVFKKNNKYYLVNPSSHYSCVKFSKNVIKKLLNYKKNKLKIGDLVISIVSYFGKLQENVGRLKSIILKPGREKEAILFCGTKEEKVSYASLMVVSLRSGSSFMVGVPDDA